MAAENLIQPLDGKIDDQSLDALFPAALSFGRPDKVQGAPEASRTWGYPFALSNLPHLAYNSNVLTGTLPLTWERLAENEEHSYVFAADGLDGAMLALQFYLDGGGQLSDEAGQPGLEMEPLQEALRYLSEGWESGLFAPQSGSMNTTDQAWQSFLGGAGNIVQTTPDHFLAQTAAGLPIAYTVIPGIDRPLAPLVGGWAWAITTTDAVKQERALALVQELITPSNLAAWSRSSNILPARRDALALWPDQGPYVGFVRQELERAGAFPISESSKLVTVLSDAVFQVASGGKSAEQAAADAVTAMRN
jgi:ABC-type glycerol-3-phosphate transport system substrate-binding protein